MSGARTATRWLASVPAVLLAGALHTLSFSPFGWWWLQLLSLAVLAHATARAAPRRAALLGWWFAVGWLVSGLWWLYISMHDYGGLHAALAASAVLVLAALLGLYYAAAMALWATLRTDRLGCDMLLWPACWLAAELARGLIFTGFPWIASGYAHAVGPLAAWAPYVGVYGLCTLAAALAFVAALWLRSAPVPGRWLVTEAVVAIALLALLLPQQFTQSTGSLRVSLLQPNVAQSVKFDAARLQSQLGGLLRQMATAEGALVVTPESVVPLVRAQLSDDYWSSLQRSLQRTPPPHVPGAAEVATSAAPSRAALVGIFIGDNASGYVNSVVAMSDGAATTDAETGQVYSYGKRHLLPFGEIIPPGFHWFVRLMNIPLADQARGRTTAAFAFAGQRLRPLVCYEDLFGEDIVSSVVGPQSATVLVNLSNLAWFGALLVQDQHLQFSQMRALEFQRPVIRSTNTGATAVVDHRGRITARLPPQVEAILETSVEGRSGETPYARWLSAYGLWPLIGAAALVMLWCAVWARALRRKSPHGATPRR